MANNNGDQLKRDNESYLEYKQRVLDTKSATFCGAKWYYATVWLNTGQTTACHHPLPHQIDEQAILNNPKLLSNTPQKKQERKEMLNGIRCKGCDYCWRAEDSGSEVVSDRVYKSVAYTENDLMTAYNSDPNDDFDLRYLEISFDRTCNFACSYCNPAFSTTWARDIKQHGPYTNIGEDGHNHYGHSHQQASRFDGGQSPYVDAFFKWWKSDLHRTLQYLRLTGGEPLMSPHTWTLFDWLEHQEHNLKYFAINTNLIAKQPLVEKLIAKSKQVDCIHIYTSNESIGAKSEYIRDGMDWTQWEKNFISVIESGTFAASNVMCTISATSMDGLVDFLDWSVKIKKQYGNNHCLFTLNILRFPAYQSVLILPQHMRNMYAEQLVLWLDKNKEHLHGMESEHVLRLIAYLTNESNNYNDHQFVSSQKFFKNYHQQYDQRRNKSFANTFSKAMVEWYNEL